MKKLPSLKIEPVPGSEPPKWRLFGYANGEKIRNVSADLAKLAAIKASAEKAHREAEMIREATKSAKITHLPLFRIHDAESADAKLLPGCSLLMAVEHYNETAGVNCRMTCEASLVLWEKRMTQMNTSARAINDNLKNARNYILATAGEKRKETMLLSEVTDDNTSEYCMAPDLAPLTNLGRASRLRAWLSFCVAKEYLKKHPMKLDLAQLANNAKPTGKPMIHSPAQIQKLIEAAAAIDGGSHLPFAILSSFCFMRASEAKRAQMQGSEESGGSLIDVSRIRLFDAKPFVMLWGGKIGSKPRKVYIPDNAAAMLKLCVKREIITEPKKDEAPSFIPFSDWIWDQIREAAGFIKIGERPHRGAHRKITTLCWCVNILRHSGISYHYQKYGDALDTTEQAGNSINVAFEHYINFPRDGDCDKFYAVTLKPEQIVEREEAIAV